MRSLAAAVLGATHIRKPVLIPMERAHPAQLAVIDALPSRRKGQYPPGTVLKFL